MRDDALRADCSRCHGLCCVALAFDRGPMFAFDKAADEPCRHLLPTLRCAVHAARERLGLAGCVHYDCYGAGQRVSQELSTGLARSEIPEAFRRLRRVHELLRMLRAARQLELAAAELETLRSIEMKLDPPEGLTAATLAELAIDAAERDVFSFAANLRDRDVSSLSGCVGRGSCSSAAGSRR